MNTQQCPFCNSTQMIPDVPVLDTGQYAAGSLTGQVGQGRPDSWWDKKPLNVTFSADICGACGRATLRVADPAALWAKYRALPPRQ